MKNSYDLTHVFLGALFKLDVERVRGRYAELFVAVSRFHFLEEIE